MDTSLIEKFRQAGQGQVFAFFATLTPAEQASLLAEAAEVDLAEVAHLAQTLLGKSGGIDLADLEPATFEKKPLHGGDAHAWSDATEAGEALLRAGRVAAFTVAGGQGTRLGYPGPKGTFPVTPVRQKPLFQVFAEKILASGRRHGREIPWFIMTSQQNHEATEAFFDEHACFGLRREQVSFFRQGRMPAVDFQGRILLETRSSLALSPDGHGGSLRALLRSGALDRMAEAGIDTISYFQVDNPLVHCIDPAFLGWHALRQSEMSSKTVLKTNPAEKVGHFCTQRGQMKVVEYSDLPRELQEARDPDGGLRFRAGSIAIHVFDREFIRRLATAPRGSGVELPFHRADKKIATIDAAGQPVKPEQPNGVKFEMFVFDALPFARHPVVIETLREDDFSPVKNAEGSDSPATSRADQLREAARWLRGVGVHLAVDGTGIPPFPLEISPRFGVDERAFREAWARLDPKPEVAAGFYLE